MVHLSLLFVPDTKTALQWPVFKQEPLRTPQTWKQEYIDGRKNSGFNQITSTARAMIGSVSAHILNNFPNMTFLFIILC